MKSFYFYFLIFLFLIGCGNGDSGSNSKIKIDTHNENIFSNSFSSNKDLHFKDVNNLDRNKDSNSVITFLTGSNIIFGTARNKNSYAYIDGVDRFVFDNPSYPIILFENSIIDINSNFIIDADDEILPFRMITKRGSVADPITTILAKGISEDSLRNFFDYNGSFYENYLEENDLFLTKISLFFVQVLYENKVSEFVDFMKNYKDKKDLNTIFYNAAEYLLKTDSSIKVLSFLIVYDFENSADIEKEISLYRGFKNNLSDISFSKDVDKIYFKIKDLGDTYILYDVFEGYDIDLSEFFNNSKVRSLIFDYSSLLTENNIFWTINYSFDCKKFNFALSGYSLDSTFVDTVNFSTLYKENDTLCLEYTLIDSNKNKQNVKIKLK